MGSTKRRNRKTRTKKKKQARSDSKPRKQKGDGSKQSSASSDKTGFVGLLDDVAKRISSVTSNYRKQLGEALQHLVEYSHQLKNSPNEWNEFCAAPKWNEFNRKKPRPDESEDYLYYILRYVCGPDRNAGKDASFYNKALKILISDGVRKDQISCEIVKRGGLRAIVDAERERQKETEHELHRNDQPDVEDSDLSGTDDPATSGTKTVSEDKSSYNKPAALGKTLRIEKSKKRMSDFEGGVFVESETQDFNMLMSLEEGQELDCSIEVLCKDKDDFRRFRFTSIAVS